MRRRQCDNKHGHVRDENENLCRSRKAGCRRHENVPEEYLVGDVYIGTEPYDESEFDNVVISGETDKNGLVSTSEFGNIDIKIKDNNYKIIVEEG